RKPLRPGGSEIGTVKLPVPVCRSGENFSPIPCIAPPPLGVEIAPLEEFDLLLIRTAESLYRSAGGPRQSCSILLFKVISRKIQTSLKTFRPLASTVGRRGATQPESRKVSPLSDSVLAPTTEKLLLARVKVFP